jgi:hypothetical protein
MAGTEWLPDPDDEDCTMHSDAYVVEQRYAGDILCAMNTAGRDLMDGDARHFTCRRG